MEVDGEWMWMSTFDLHFNVRDFGPHPELMKALDAYNRG